LTGLCLALIAIMRAFPHAPFSRWLHRHTVAKIASWGRRHIVFAGVFVALMLFGQSWLALTSYDMVVAFAWDASLWVDAAVIATAVKAFRRRR
jgi:hypothetical protein